MKYNETTKVRDTEIRLNEKEQQGVTDFHKSRIAFAFLEDGTIAINAKDQREHKVYLQEDFGISEERTITLTRGYIKPGKIVFYKSFYYDPVEDDLLHLVQSLGVTTVQFFGEGIYEIWNGVQIGEMGTEWPALSIPYILNLSLRFTKGQHQLNIEEMK